MVETRKKPAGKRRKSGARFIVGIGSSAGGLEALRALFSALASNVPMALIVVQHLAPSHKSRLVEILAQSTSLRVKEVEDGERPQAKTVYITPPNADIYIEGGALRLMEPHLKIGPKPSVDYFFRSLAEHFGSSAIGVILSGTGSDGAHGVRAIKAAGGFTICQKAVTAKYDGMPKAAKHTGAVDLELSPEEIAQELSRFGKIPAKRTAQASAPLEEEDHFERIFAILEREKGACFASYKPSTVRRRVERRVIATRCASIAEYADYLRNNPSEADNLFQDILISVTAFFRDAEAFQALSQHIDAKVAAKADGQSFRCWIIGCATGEEAYSMAILISESVERHKRNLNLQIFATDLDAIALDVARRGCYSRGSFDKFPPNLREKYFVANEEQFQIRPSLRDSIIFARHNVIEDPPFLNTDLVSCRNVLIYFNHNLQEKVFRTICYSLGKGGILFLGKSEAVSGTASGLFQVQDKESRIYYSTRERGIPAVTSGRSVSFEHMNPRHKPDNKAEGGGLELFHAMIESFAPDSLIVDEELRVKHLFGKANEYLEFPKGEATYNVTKLLPPELGIELPSLVYRAAKSSSAVPGKRHELNRAGSTVATQLTVVPLKPAEEPKQYLVAFQRAAPADPVTPSKPGENSSAKPEERVVALEKELLAVTEQLQSLLEEHQASNEELQSLNEELQSANEELQSANEELETTNEELQSSNEELTTLNQELNVKSTELQMLYNRHQAIQNAIVYPLLIVDAKLSVVDFNPAARHLLRLSESDVGTQLQLVPTPLDLDEVVAAAVRALRNQKDLNLQLATKDRSFEVQIQIFSGEKNSVGGAVISFVDNTEIIASMEEAKVMKARLSSIIDNTPAMVTMKDLSGVYTFANNRFCEVTNRHIDEVLGSTDEEIFGKESARTIRELDFEVMKQEEPLQFEESYTLDGTVRYWASSKFILSDARNRAYSVCTISLDITDRANREHQLLLFRAAIASANSGTVILEDAGSGFEVSFCSAQVGSLFAIDASATLGLSLLEFLGRIRAQVRKRALSDVVHAIEAGRENGMTVSSLLPNGKELSFELRSAIIRQDNHEPRHLILSIFDVSEHLASQQTILSQQEELARYARFSALGEIAAGISHEINTPLNVITANADILKRSVQLQKLTDVRVLESAADIEKMAKSISNIVQGLKSVAGIDPGTTERASMQKLVQDALKICELRLQRSEVALDVDLPDQEIQVYCYPIQIMQVIINLVNNAVEAIAGSRDPWIKICLTEKEEKACISVTDSGNGIDAGIAEKIMTPFFSTKKQQNGTGMGLSLSRSIARRHNGDLYLDPSTDNTTFCLEIAKA